MHSSYDWYTSHVSLTCHVVMLGQLILIQAIKVFSSEVTVNDMYVVIYMTPLLS